MRSPSIAGLATISALTVVPSIVSNSLAALITASGSPLFLGLPRCRLLDVGYIRMKGAQPALRERGHPAGGAHQKDRA